ncbi:putative bifunctional diguanylate cyclase/phosphodiesterase [Candidatus Symbiobacter mobilis]|uniref:Signal transduction protein n=1 Tax=Candidatus Symbiobacter mobilis CR TaxID=946483 RepID=U5N8W4_9BURK|nr:EAL domain-containing response regulator [Candidatus Symbiobacter mobilis]AGX87765.1 signal transduction protein [Candidatus Symbiobacter mobilis CR]
MNAPISSAHTTRILIADDDPTVGLLLQAALASQGYVVMVHEDGASALESFRNDPADLVLLDVEMPERNGYEVCEEIRQGLESDVPVILITGHDDVASIDRAYEVGATDFIPKPLNWTLIAHRIRYVLRSFHDAAQRRIAEKQVRYLAYFDTLTNLPNRQSFLEILQQEIDRALRTASTLAVLYLDLDNFKSVNDSLGHQAGDVVLQRVADRLRVSLRSFDVLGRPAPGAHTREIHDAGVQVARHAGDEFTMLLPILHKADDALSAAQRIRESVARPLFVDGRELFITASIGIALFPDDQTDAQTLVNHAETAMYAAKDLGRNHCEYYSASLTERAVGRFAMESALRYALERNEFELVYQPQIDVVTRTAHAVEALIRWHHPVRGMVSPLEFIHIAEETGMIHPLGSWVLHTACKQAQQWIAEVGMPIRVCVNISPVQFRAAGFLDEVMATLEATGLQPECLELEITENVLMDDSGKTLADICTLRRHGIHIAIDDFGTGYSSLRYLKRLPLTKLKIDRAFVRDMPDSREDEAIVRAVVALADSLDMHVTAEGVETRQQFETLRALGCDSIQGYYFSRPVSSSCVAEMFLQPIPEDLPL